jgi:hypothetical protein
MDLYSDPYFGFRCWNCKKPLLMPEYGDPPSFVGREQGYRVKCAKNIKGDTQKTLCKGCLITYNKNVVSSNPPEQPQPLLRKSETAALSALSILTPSLSNANLPEA